MRPMSATLPTPPPVPMVAGGPPAIPTAIWVFGWSFVVEGVIRLLTVGPKDDAVSAVVSMLLSALVVSFFAAGVLRARAVRTTIVAVLVGLGLVLGVVGVVAEATVDGSLALAFSALQAVLLWRYTRSPWWAWQRTRPVGGPSPAPVLAVAVLAGLVGGLPATPTESPDVTIRVSGPVTPS